MPFTTNLLNHLRTLYAQLFRITLAPYVLPRLLARSQPGLSCMVQSFVSSHTTELYDPRAFFTHAALLHQGSPHCAISPTAASRRSLDRVSVPMWPFTLSGRLLIVALVGSYPTNQLIRRKLVCDRFRFAVSISQSKQFISYQLTFLSVIRVSQVDYLRVTHPSATKLYIFHPKTSYIHFVRLACVRHAASVHPEPGSNSQLKFILQLLH